MVDTAPHIDDSDLDLGDPSGILESGTDRADDEAEVDGAIGAPDSLFFKVKNTFIDEVIDPCRSTAMPGATATYSLPCMRFNFDRNANGEPNAGTTQPPGLPEHSSLASDLTLNEEAGADADKWRSQPSAEALAADSQHSPSMPLGLPHGTEPLGRALPSYTVGSSVGSEAATATGKEATQWLFPNEPSHGFQVENTFRPSVAQDGLVGGSIWGRTDGFAGDPSMAWPHDEEASLGQCLGALGVECSPDPFPKSSSSSSSRPPPPSQRPPPPPPAPLVAAVEDARLTRPAFLPLAPPPTQGAANSLFPAAPGGMSIHSMAPPPVDAQAVDPGSFFSGPRAMAPHGLGSPFGAMPPVDGPLGLGAPSLPSAASSFSQAPAPLGPVAPPWLKTDFGQTPAGPCGPCGGSCAACGGLAEPSAASSQGATQLGPIPAPWQTGSVAPAAAAGGSMPLGGESLGDAVPVLEPPATRKPQPSRGSNLHASRRCKPCAWYWRPQGCINLHECEHCHMCEDGELKARKREKVAALRASAVKATRGKRPAASKLPVQLVDHL